MIKERFIIGGCIRTGKWNTSVHAIDSLTSEAG
jgi:hypothetical protein